jgi:Dna[CI] antecedent, DciA
MAIIPKPFRNYKLGPPPMNQRERALAQWRGIDLGPLEKGRALRARRAGDCIPQVLKDMRLERRLSEAEILKVWNGLVDPAIAAHAQPTGVHKGTLFVTVDNSVWLSEIVRYRRKEILDRLQHSFGREMITRIMFKAAG